MSRVAVVPRGLVGRVKNKGTKAIFKMCGGALCFDNLNFAMIFSPLIFLSDFWCTVAPMQSLSLYLQWPPNQLHFFGRSTR